MCLVLSVSGSSLGPFRTLTLNMHVFQLWYQKNQIAGLIETVLKS